MYLVKKCEHGWNSGYGRSRRKWKTVLATESKQDAIAFFKMELRYVLEADHNLDRKTIEARLDNYYLSERNVTHWYGRRIEQGHGEVGFAVYKSEAKEYDVPIERPAPSAILDKILNR